MKSTRGRPAKKPGYNREAEIKNLIDTAVNLAVEPFDGDERDADLPTLTEIADTMETTLLRVRKILITADYFTSEMSRTVQRLNEQGMSVAEIMAATGLSKASVYSYLPHSKGVYNLDEPTLYSEQGKRYRSRKSAVEELIGHENLPDVNLYLWKAIIAFRDYPFVTSGRGSRHGVKFKYEVSKDAGAGGKHYSRTDVLGYGNELWITAADGGQKKKSISRSTVEFGYRNGRALMNAEGKVADPKALGVPEAGSYLYPILLRFGVIKNGAET